jgi:hypothetical protein
MRTSDWRMAWEDAPLWTQTPRRKDDTGYTESREEYVERLAEAGCYELAPWHRRVLSALGHSMGRDGGIEGKCSPTFPLLTKRTGYGEDRCREIVVELDALGWLTVHRLKGKPNLYFARIPSGYPMKCAVCKHRAVFKGVCGWCEHEVSGT